MRVSISFNIEDIDNVDSIKEEFTIIERDSHKYVEIDLAEITSFWNFIKSNKKYIDLLELAAIICLI